MRAESWNEIDTRRLHIQYGSFIVLREREDVHRSECTAGTVVVSFSRREMIEKGVTTGPARRPRRRRRSGRLDSKIYLSLLFTRLRRCEIIKSADAEASCSVTHTALSALPTSVPTMTTLKKQRDSPINLNLISVCLCLT